MIKLALGIAILVVSVFGLWLQDANYKAISADVAALRTTTAEIKAGTTEVVEAQTQVDTALDRVRTQLADALRPKTPAKK